MKSSIPNERQSAPTGAQVPENQEQADRPLGDAACSLSSFSAEDMLKFLDSGIKFTLCRNVVEETGSWVTVCYTELGTAEALTTTHAIEITLEQHRKELEQQHPQHALAAGAQEPENQEQAERPLGDAACSLIFSLLEHLMAELDATLCPTGYARCQEIKDRRTQYIGTKWEGWRVYRLDFGHFYIDIASDGKDPTPHILAVAEEHCTPDQFLGELNEGINTRHRPHVGTVSARLDFTKYARSIREGFIGFGKDKPSAGGAVAPVSVNKLVDSE